jgi:hypothetical protein
MHIKCGMRGGNIKSSCRGLLFLFTIIMFVLSLLKDLYGDLSIKCDEVCSK